MDKVDETTLESLQILSWIFSETLKRKEVEPKFEKSHDCISTFSARMRRLYVYIP